MDKEVKMSINMKALSDVFDKVVNIYYQLYKEELTICDVIAILRGTAVEREGLELKDRMKIANSIKNNMGIDWMYGGTFRDQKIFTEMFNLSETEFNHFLMLSDMDDYFEDTTNDNKIVRKHSAPVLHAPDCLCYDCMITTENPHHLTNQGNSSTVAAYSYPGNRSNDIPFFFDNQDYNLELTRVATVLAGAIKTHLPKEPLDVKNIVEEAALLIKTCEEYSKANFKKE